MCHYREAIIKKIICVSLVLLYLASYAFYTTLSVCHYREAEGLAMADMRAYSHSNKIILNNTK